jgi:hypothetical protein
MDVKEKEYLANAVLQSIYDLKRQDRPFHSRQCREFYLIDEHFDVQIEIRLIPKRTQKELFRDMLK